jgi:uncharacterized protein (TIGR02599 family)
VEVLVTCVILSLVGVLTFTIVSQATSLWSGRRASVTAFEGARAGFEYLTRHLEQATLGTYWDYDDPEKPTRYQRRSELHFLMGNAAALTGSVQNVGQAIFFQAPLGFTSQRSEGGARDYRSLHDMLNAVGFYVHFGPQVNLPDFLQNVLPERYRFRLMHFREPSEKLSLYAIRQADGSPDLSWVRDNLAAHSLPIAENVVALIFRVKYPEGAGEAEAFAYDSAGESNPATHHQLPPVVTVTMAVIDEASASRLQARFGSERPDLQIDDLFDESGKIPSGKYDSDLRLLEETLRECSVPLNYRIFSADVALRGARWSR